MSAAIGDLVIKFGADIAQILTATDQIHRKLEKLNYDAGQLTEGINSKFRMLGAGLAAYFTIDAFKSLISDSIHAQDALQDLSERTGETVENLSKLVNVGKLSGTGIDTITGAMDKLAKGLAKADSETSGAEATLKALGVAVRDASGNFRSGVDITNDLARALEGYKDSMGKVQVLQQVYGRGGASMANLMHDIAKATDITATVTSEGAKQSEELYQQWVRLQIAGEDLKNKAVVAMLPPMLALAQTLLDLGNNSDSARSKLGLLAKDGSITSWAEVGGNAIALMIDMVKDAVVGLGLIFKGLRVAWDDLRIINQASLFITNPTMLLDKKAVANFKSLLNEEQAAVDSFMSHLDMTMNRNPFETSDAYIARVRSNKAQASRDQGAQAYADENRAMYGGGADKTLDDLMKKLMGQKDAAAAAKKANEDYNKTLEQIAQMSAAAWVEADRLALGLEKPTAAMQLLTKLESSDVWSQWNETQRATVTTWLLQVDAQQRANTALATYTATMQQFAQIAASAEADIMAFQIGGESASAAIKKLAEQMVSPAWETMSLAQQEAAINAAFAADAFIQEAENLKLLAAVEDATAARTQNLSAVTVKTLKAIDAEFEKSAQSSEAWAARNKKVMDALSNDAYFKRLKDQNNALKDEIEVIGLVGVARDVRLLQLQKERDLADAMDPVQRKMIENYYDEQIALIRAKDAQQKHADAMTSAIKTMVDYGESFFQSFAEGMKGVSDWAKRVGQDLKRWVLTALYELTVKKWIVQIGGDLLGLSGGTISSLIGSMGTGSADVLTTLLGGGGGGTLGTLGSLGGVFSGASAFLTGGSGALAANMATMTGNFALAAGASGELAGTLAGIASGIGTVAPYLLAALAIAYAFGAFDKKPSEVRGQFGISSGTTGFEDQAYVSSPFGNLGFLDAATQYFSGEGAKKFSQIFADLFTAIAKDLSPEQISRISTNLQATQFPQLEGTYTTEDFIAKYGPDIYKSVTAVIFDELNPAFAALIRQFNGTIEETAQFVGSLAALDKTLDKLPLDVARQLEAMVTTSAESVTRVTALATAYATLQDAMNADPLEEALTAIENANTGAYQSFQRSITALHDAMEAFDGSTESANALTVATANYHAAMVNLLAAFEQLRNEITGVGGSIDQAIRSITMAGMSPEEQFNFLQSETEALRARAKTSTDPAEIAQLNQQILSNITTAFGLLSPEQQAANRAQFLSQLETWRTEANTLITNAETATMANAATQMEDLRNLLQTEFQKFTTGANAVQTGGASILTAAQTPITLTVDIRGLQQTTLVNR